MNKIEKFLRKLNKKEQKAFLLLMLQIKKDYTKIPDIKALTGKKNCFRVRFGKYRIIFKIPGSGDIEIIRVTKRDEQTYKNL